MPEPSPSLRSLAGTTRDHVRAVIARCTVLIGEETYPGPESLMRYLPAVEALLDLRRPLDVAAATGLVVERYEEWATRPPARTDEAGALLDECGLPLTEMGAVHREWEDDQGALYTAGHIDVGVEAQELVADTYDRIRREATAAITDALAGHPALVAQRAAAWAEELDKVERRTVIDASITTAGELVALAAATGLPIVEKTPAPPPPLQGNRQELHAEQERERRRAEHRASQKRHLAELTGYVKQKLADRDTGGMLRCALGVVGDSCFDRPDPTTLDLGHENGGGSEERAGGDTYAPWRRARHLLMAEAPCPYRLECHRHNRRRPAVRRRDPAA